MALEENHTADYGAVDKAEKGGRLKTYGNSAVLTAGIIIADVVGAGILSMAVAVAHLGWILGAAAILGLLAMNVHVAILMWRVRMDFPNAGTYCDLVGAAFSKAPEYQRKLASNATAVTQNIFILCMLGLYTLSAGRGFGNMFYSVHLCLPVWSAIGCGLLLPFHLTARRLGKWKSLVYLNVATIVGTTAIPLVFMFINGVENTRPPGSSVFAIADLSVSGSLAALSTFTFAFTSQFMIAEIINEMEDPAEFPKAYIWMAAPFQAVAFLAVGLIGYYYMGDAVAGMIGDNIPFGITFQVAAFCLVSHMLITYLIKGIVICRAVQGAWDKELVESDAHVQSCNPAEFHRLVNCVVAEYERQTELMRAEIERLSALQQPTRSAVLNHGELCDNPDALRATLSDPTPAAKSERETSKTSVLSTFGSAIPVLDLPEPASFAESIKEHVSEAMVRMHAPRDCVDRAERAIMWFASLKEPERSGPCYNFITAKYFVGCCMSVILLNTWFIVHASNVEMNWILQHDGETNTNVDFSWRQSAEICFTCFYVIELSLRLFVHRLYFFVNDDKLWNIMDSALVVFAGFELPFLFASQRQHNPSLTYMRLLRIMKVVRGFRFLRLFPFLRELRLMLDCVIHSAAQLCWCILLVIFVLCMFSIIFVQTLTAFIADRGATLRDETWQKVDHSFGTVWSAMLSLFMATTGGADWEGQYLLFWEVGKGPELLYVFFIAFFFLAVWNIVMSIFVEKALQLAIPDIDTLMADKHARDARDAKDMLEMLTERLDENKDGLIQLSEFAHHIRDEKFAQFLEFRGYDIKNLVSFFEMVRSVGDHGDAAEISTFVSCCLRLHGLATSIDLQTLRFEMKLLLGKQMQRMNDLERSVLPAAAPVDEVKRQTSAKATGAYESEATDMQGIDAESKVGSASL